MYITVFSLFVTLVFGIIVIYAFPDQLGRRGASSIEHTAYAESQLLGDLLPVVHQAAQRYVEANPGTVGPIDPANVSMFLPASFRAAPRFESQALANGAVLTRVRGPDALINQSTIASRASRLYRTDGIGFVRGGMIISPAFADEDILAIPAGFTTTEGEVVLYSPRLP